ncbi:plasmid pRiA4b ORF-3 family protein [Corynebacterium amycolatum]|uniref:plasmid pRiA4b ORF-3 family protein n=1 Tax=Corynebacterium amycolatum TaxID=43765 RepID=UPI00211A8764|nr:plasmid pRiA4b ORF-3 family protein [Corynebacterium amycolatum]MCQ9127482.1 hypothetical protein [Corynebacterium amycolatum]MCQ9141919.1 hypothetical protein [Corynebacterium amycolatum]
MAAQTDNVVAFPGVRVATEPATLIIGASLEEEPCSAHRVFGVNDQMDLRSLSRVLAVIFGWGDESVPTKFHLPGSAVESVAQLVTGGRPAAGGVVDVPLSTTVAEVLQSPGDTLIWQWGLWEHTLQVREAFARDEATPNALCIGGSGSIRALGDVDAEEPVDIAAINRELTGRDSIQNTLAAARADVVDIIERSGVFEFVPLLQALDLQRSESTALELTGEAGESVVKRLRALPIEDAEKDPAGHDAALVELLCLAALTSDELRHDVAAHVMERLGWESDEGIPLSGEDVEELAAASWAEMSALGLAGEDVLSPVERLDLLREALRR